MAEMAPDVGASEQEYSLDCEMSAKGRLQNKFCNR